MDEEPKDADKSSTSILHSVNSFECGFLSFSNLEVLKFIKIENLNCEYQKCIKKNQKN